MIPLAPSPVRFANFELDPLSGELRRHGLSVRLTPQAMTLLCLLVEAPIRMRTREEIQQRLWKGNTFVDFEHSLNKIVHSLREMLGDSATNPRFIETVAAKGYRFLPQQVERGAPAGNAFSYSRVERLAVLPIATNRKDDLTLMGGRITSSLIDGLSAINGLRVMAETTVRSRKLEGICPQQAGGSLGVQSVLSGVLTRHDESWYLRVELIDVADGAQICGARVEGTLQPRMQGEEELAREVIRQIAPSLARPLSKLRMVRKTMLVARDKESVA